MAFVPTTVLKNTTANIDVAAALPIEEAAESVASVYSWGSNILTDMLGGEKNKSKFVVLSSIALVGSSLGVMYYMNKNRKQWDLQTDADGYVYYFGYGSNMSLQTLEFKGVGEIRRTRRAVLKDWDLNFGYWRSSRSNPGNGCVNPSLGSEVHGMLFDLTSEQLTRLDRAQLSYTRILVPIEIYAEDGGQIVNAYVYTFSNEYRDELLTRPQFSPFNVPHFKKDNLPGYNYLQTLVRGAMESRLRPSYVQKLRRMPAINYLSLTDELLATIPNREYSMAEIERTRADENPLYAIRGVVFQWTGHHASRFKKYIAGRDITRFVGSRYAYGSNENIVTLDAFESEQKKYVSSELASWLAGPSDLFPVEAIATRGVPVGRCGLEIFDETWECNPHYVHYFAYGRDMRQLSLDLKGLGKPATVRRGILRDYRMTFSSFSNERSNPGHGCVIESNGDEVHGVMYDIDVDQMRLLDEQEEMYAKIRVPIDLYEEDGGGRIIAFIYTLTEERCRQCAADPLRIACNNFMPQFQLDSRPGRNQLDALIVGGQSRHLRESHAEELQRVEGIPYLDLTPEMLESVPDREFTMEEVESSVQSEQPLTILRGVVCEVVTQSKGIRMSFAGNDITELFAKRWAFCDPRVSEESLDLAKLDPQQKKYVSSLLASHILGPINPSPCVYNLIPAGRYLLDHYQDDSWF